MSSAYAGRKKLSKSILEMKFMKRSKEKALLDEEEEHGRAVFSSDLTEAMRLESDRFVIEKSFVPCEELIIGRLSYHGMNPEIERLLELERAAREGENVKEEADVTEAEMAKHYSSVVHTLANKFKTKAQRASEAEPPTKKPKFLKPEDD